MEAFKIRKNFVLNRFVGYHFFTEGFFVELFRRDDENWNYRVKRGYTSEVIYYVYNACYDRRKDAVGSALDWISLNKGK